MEIIDCKIYEDYCKSKQTGSFPSINIYKKGVKKQYKSPERDADSIVNWFGKNAVFFGTVLNSKEEIEKFKSENKKYVIGYFPLGVSESYRVYDYVANGYLSNRFNFAVVKDLKNVEGEINEERIGVFNGEEEVVIKKDDFSSLDETGLSKKIFDTSFPLVSEVSEELFREYRERRKDVYLSFIETSNPQQKQAYLDTLRKLATEYTQFSFGYVPYENNLEVVEEFGVPDNSSQSIVRYNFFEMVDDAFFTPPKPFTFDAISEWIKEINPTVHSQFSQKQTPTKQEKDEL